MQCINGECCDDPFNVTLPNIVTTDRSTSSLTVDYNRSGVKPTSEKPFMTCGDTSSSCRVMMHLCVNAVYEVMMERHCTRTCNKCSLKPRTPKLRSRHCRDLGSNCPRLQPYCQSTAYSAMLRTYCPKTCHLC
ncbi:unnamed protein product [Bursaphelenchus okinawaensis]|uniref:ShKT domain-containing protein n=1 Tax=Bursaphelenchus okinawaensis TaxID=465554 RepID=A0A811L5K6_9BILA|nr:unnamed protein product [Bursaphelenchus okinawaensis]CAG9118109.1 unnamed protein product [Bursaphelenchus okinawaensis]